MLLIMQTQYINVLYSMLKNKHIYIKFILSLMFINLQFFITKIAFYFLIFYKNIAQRYIYLYITIFGITSYNNFLTKLSRFF